MTRLRRPGRERPDSEALTLRTDGTIVVAMEGEHSLLELPQGGGRPRQIGVPPALRAAPRNLGIEALATLADGSLLAIAEGVEAEPGRNLAMLLNGQSSRRLSYPPEPGFKPTGADRIDDWLLVVERRVSFPLGLSARLTASPLPGGLVPADGRLAPIELATLARLGSTDNIEGVAAEPGAEPGSYRIWLVADDNFSRIQRTLLLVLSWRSAPPA